VDTKFEDMDFGDEVDYIFENIDELPDDMTDSALSILVQAGEIDTAAGPDQG
jgi:hypothetical protein